MSFNENDVWEMFVSKFLIGFDFLSFIRQRKRSLLWFSGFCVPQNCTFLVVFLLPSKLWSVSVFPIILKSILSEKKNFSSVFILYYLKFYVFYVST